MTLTISALLLSIYFFKIKKQSPWFLLYFVLFPAFSYFDIHYLNLGSQRFESFYFYGLCSLSFLFSLAGALDFFVLKKAHLSYLPSCIVFLGVGSLYQFEAFYVVSIIQMTLYSFHLYKKRQEHTHDFFWLYFGCFVLLIFFDTKLEIFEELAPVGYALISIFLLFLFLARLDLFLLLAGAGLVFNMSLFYDNNQYVFWTGLSLLGVLTFLKISSLSSTWVLSKVKAFPFAERCRTFILILSSPERVLSKDVLSKADASVKESGEPLRFPRSENILAQQCVYFGIVFATALYFFILEMAK